MRTQNLVLTERDFVYALFTQLKLLPSSNTKHKAKLSSAELERNLIVFNPQQTSIDLFFYAINNDGMKQPFFMRFGTKDNPASFYLILDCKSVSLGNCRILRAVDCLFKAHYVFWVDYAKSTAVFMEFLQRLFTKSNAPRVTARVREISNSISAFMKRDTQDNVQPTVAQDAS
jgi:hypothetical protein